jgi:hypothetical protein
MFHVRAHSARSEWHYDELEATIVVDIVPNTRTDDSCLLLGGRGSPLKKQ